MDCKHEVHKEAMKLLEAGLTHNVQCLKCGQALSTVSNIEKGKAKSSDKNESVGT